jgi:transcriptional regulator with XRE-family HTH domain
MKNIQMILARKKKGMGQVALSKVLGVSQAYVSFVESGTKTPSKSMSDRIFAVLRVRVAHESKAKKLSRVIGRLSEKKLDILDSIIRAAEKESV